MRLCGYRISHCMAFLKLQLYLKTWGVETIYSDNIIGIIKTYGFKVNKIKLLQAMPLEFSPFLLSTYPFSAPYTCCSLLLWLLWWKSLRIGSLCDKDYIVACSWSYSFSELEGERTSFSFPAGILYKIRVWLRVVLFLAGVSLCQGPGYPDRRTIA